jgi:hypothetical protein
MTISAWWWTAIAQNGGRLHLLHLALSLLASCLLLLVLIVALGDPVREWLTTGLTTWRGESRRLVKSTGLRSMIHAVISTFSIKTKTVVYPSTPEEIDEVRQVVDETKRHIPPKGFARPWAIVSVCIIILSWSGWAWLAIRDSRRISELELELAKYRSDTVVEHHVALIGRLDDGDFAFRSDEEPNGGRFRPCPADIVNGVDVVGILSQGVGYVADHAAWEERGVCKSVMRADLGFWWNDEKFKLERTTQ